MSRLLTLQDDSAGFEFAGNAFKVTGAAADIDDLKKVQTEFDSSCFRTSFRRAMTKIERSCLQHVL